MVSLRTYRPRVMGNIGCAFTGHLLQWYRLLWSAVPTLWLAPAPEFKNHMSPLPTSSRKCCCHVMMFWSLALFNALISHSGSLMPLLHRHGPWLCLCTRPRKLTSQTGNSEVSRGKQSSRDHGCSPNVIASCMKQNHFQALPQAPVPWAEVP